VTHEKKPDTNLLKLFGVEHLATLKTLVNESRSEVEKKTPNDASMDIRKLLDEITVHVASRNIDGCIDCLNAIQLRVDYMQRIASDIKKAQGR
jgi:hypothetical protein